MNTMLLARIEPTPEIPEPNPPTSGNWIRDEDGGLRPADAATAATAGMAFDEPADATTKE
jgi:hypothetical protein